MDETGLEKDFIPLSVIHLFPTCTELPEVTESRFCFILFSPSDTGRDDVHVSEMENEVLEGLGQGAGSRELAGPVFCQGVTLLREAGDPGEVTWVCVFRKRPPNHPRSLAPPSTGKPSFRGNTFAKPCALNSVRGGVGTLVITSDVGKLLGADGFQLPTSP